MVKNLCSLISQSGEIIPEKAGISELLYTKLPAPTYTEKECESKGIEVYNFVYEHCQDIQDLVAA